MKIEDEAMILCAVGGLPPVIWLDYCHTPDQQEHWNDIRKTFQGVYAELNTYFAGQSRPATSVAPEVNQLYELVSRRYIELYAVIRNGWKLIVETAKHLDIQLGAKTPGEYLVLIIEGDCAVTFSQCLGYNEYRPRYLHEMYRLRGKVGSLNVAGKSLTKSEKQNVAKFEKYKKQSQRTSQENSAFWAHYLFAMEVLQKSRDVNVVDLLRRYRQTNADLDQYLHKLMHPSKKQRGFKFVNGVRQPLS